MRMAKELKSSFDAMTFLSTTNRGRTISNFEKNRIIFSQGDPADAVLYLRKGEVKIAVTSPQGKEAVVGILKTGAFFGEECLIGEPVRIATASALIESVVTRVTKAEMLQVLHDEPSLAALFMQHLLRSNKRIHEDLVDRLFNSSEKRLARALLLLANFGDEDQGGPVPLQISQEMLAEMVGTTRPRINFFMNKFRRLGYIDYNGALEIRRSLLNVLLRD